MTPRLTIVAARLRNVAAGGITKASPLAGEAPR
jgi:hypothetical protein